MPWSYHNDKLLTWEKKEGKEKKKLQQKIGVLVPTTPKLLLHLWQNSLHFSQSLSASSQGIWPHPDPPLDTLLLIFSMWGTNKMSAQGHSCRQQELAVALPLIHPFQATTSYELAKSSVVEGNWYSLGTVAMCLALHISTPNCPWWQAPTRSLQLRAVAAPRLSHKEGHHPPAASLPPTASSCSNHHLLPVASIIYLLVFFSHTGIISDFSLFWKRSALFTPGLVLSYSP